MTRKSKGLLVDSKEVALALQETLSEASLRARQKFSMYLGKCIDERLREHHIHEVVTVVKDTLEQWTRQQSCPEILPSGTRMCVPNLDGGFNIVIEEPPRVRTLKIWRCVTKDDPVSGVPEAEVFSLSLPYIIFVFHFRSLDYLSNDPLVFCRTLPLRDQQDTLCFFPLTNVSPSDGRICMSGTKLSEVKKVGCLSTWVDKFRTTFWQSEFTKDYNERIRWLALHRKSHFSSLDVWQRWSVANPIEVLKIKFEKYLPLKTVLIRREKHGLANNLKIGVLRSIKDSVERAVAQVYDASKQWVDDFSMLDDKIVGRATKIFEAYLSDTTRDLRMAYEIEIAGELGRLEKKIEIEASRIMGEEGPKTGKMDFDISNPW